jgi:hypothetical protein
MLADVSEPALTVDHWRGAIEHWSPAWSSRAALATGYTIQAARAGAVKSRITQERREIVRRTQ